MQEYQTDDDHLFHWGLNYLSAEYEYGMVVGTIFTEHSDSLRGVCESKELALRDGRDRHSRLCPLPLSIRYDDVVHHYGDGY